MRCRTCRASTAAASLGFGLPKLVGKKALLIASAVMAEKIARKTCWPRTCHRNAKHTAIYTRLLPLSQH